MPAILLASIKAVRIAGMARTYIDKKTRYKTCLLYTTDAADECVKV